MKYFILFTFRQFYFYSITFLILIGCIGCSQNIKVTDNAKSEKSYAVYGEYARDSNKLMKPNLNRRVFNVTEAQSGTDIKLEKDGSITLKPGTYHIQGFSMVTMQATFAPPVIKNNNNYPGYCLLYPKQYESDTTILKHQICIGSPCTAYDTAPSLIDVMYTCDKEINICLGHQSGADLHNEVYISVYSVDGIPSEYHAFARLAITKM
jgi:hypothetical protein